MGWSAYEQEAVRRYRTLLNSDPDEKSVQRFLEIHPSFVPGGRIGGTTTPSEVTDLLITQPRLPGLKEKRPDFMWLVATSDTWFPTLIEIERPGKLLFRKDGKARKEFTEAHGQLLEWKQWFNSPVNQELFQRSYVPSAWGRKRMRFKAILVFGRRSEFVGRDLENRRGYLPGEDCELMSFDRLVPSSVLQNAITVHPVAEKRFRAVTVPPTFEIGPSTVERLSWIDGISEAIDQSADWQPERRTFVKKRIPYWRNWLANDKGFVRVGDAE